MARVVLATWGSYGDLFPIVGLALELKRRGHDAVVATCGFYGELVTSLGLGFHAVPPDIDPTDRQMFEWLLHARRGPDRLLRELLSPAIEESYAATEAAARGADLLVSHPVTFAVPLVARKHGIPFVSTALAPLTLFSRHDFPVLPGIPGSAFLRERGPTVRRILHSLVRALSRHGMAPVDRLRERLGLPDAGHPLFEGQFSPLATLALFPTVLAEPQPDWPPNVVRAGFVSYNGPDPMPQALLEFLDAGPPPVTFTLGTSAVGAPGDFFREAAAACVEAGCRGVLLVGRLPGNESPSVPAQGVMAVDYAPHAELFPRSAVIVHQAGMGTTSQALRAGKPQLIVPHAHDQPDNAYRVNQMGVARVCTPTRFRSARVASHLRDLLAEGPHRIRAEALARTVRMDRGADAAADKIEEVLRNRKEAT